MFFEEIDPVRLANRFRRVSLAAATGLCTLSLAACGQSEEEPQPDPAPAASETDKAPETETSEAQESSESQTPATSSAESASESAADESEPADSSAAKSSQAAGDEKLEESVAEVYEIFSSLAPRSLFAQFDSCDSVGMRDSYNCTDAELGSIQFYKSSSQAAQATQVLTGLRNGHVVKDEGDILVGWSTLGTDTILSVVDNDKGLVMKQLAPSDVEEPEELLAELGVL